MNYIMRKILFKTWNFDHFSKAFYDCAHLHIIMFFDYVFFDVHSFSFT